MMKHWKTTLAGAVLAALEVSLSYFEKEEVNYKALGLAVAIALLGYVARDREVVKE